MKRAWLLAGVPLCASSGASLCSCPTGCVGLLGVCPFSMLFFQGSWGKSSATICCSLCPAKSAGMGWARRGPGSLKMPRPASCVPPALQCHLPAPRLTFSHCCYILLLAAALCCGAAVEDLPAQDWQAAFCRRGQLYLANTDCLPCSEPALGLFSLEWVSLRSSTTGLCLANLMN